MYDLIDISNYQDVYDLAAVYSQVQCVYHHATEGNWVNPVYAPRRDGGRSLAKPFGSYLFLRPGGSKPQTDLFKSVVGDLSPNDPRPMLDIEYQGVTAYDVRVAQEELAPWIGEYPFAYGGMPLLCKLAQQDQAILASPLWFAWYPDDVSTVQTILARYTRLRLGGFATDPWDTPTIWQYTSSGNLPGINGRVDLNKFWKGITLDDILINPPLKQQEDRMPSVIPAWVNYAAEGDKISHYRVIRALDGSAVFQASGICNIHGVTPGPDGVSEVPLGVPYDNVTGMDMTYDGKRCVVTGIGWNTWAFETDRENPSTSSQPLDVQAIAQAAYDILRSKLI